ncbi:phage tail assembly chaperone [Megalodesulfovibrio paquesii]
MLKLTPDPQFTAKVGITVPGQDAPAQITVTYKYMTRSQAQAWGQGLGEKTDNEALADVVLGWEGVDAPYSRETLDQLLDAYPAAGLELLTAFRQNLLESRRKN